jgi:glycosyltransferase involved in cell wall biosynthesis
MTHTSARDEPTCQAESLRIGMFSESFDPVQNGVTTSLLTLVAGLRALNHHVCVFAPAHQQQRPNQTNVLRFPSFVSAFNRGYPLAYPFVPRLMLETHFDGLKLQIVHTHTPFVLGLTGAKLAIRRGVPLVSTFHTLYSQYSHYVPLLPESVTQALIEHYLPWYYNRCVQIMCPSGVAECALRALGVTRPIEVIPTGIPLPDPAQIGSAARVAARRSMGVAPTAPVLLYAGRMAPEKNIPWLLEAFAVILTRLPDARLVLAGGGLLADELQTRASEMGIAHATLFLGPTPRTEMDTIYAAADVFCFPSPSETQGLVVGEARAAGTPCVVVDSGGAPETVRDGEDGFRTPVGNSDAFVRRILTVLENRALANRMRANALRNAAQFTPERMVQRVLAVYHRARIAAPLPIDLTAIDTEPLPLAGTMDIEGQEGAIYDGTSITPEP